MGLLLSFAQAALGAGQWQDLDAVRTGAVQFARQQTADLPGTVSIAAGPLDPRLQLAACNTMEFFIPTGNRLWGNSNVGVRCPPPSSWTVYIPVTVKVQTDIAFATRPLNSGQSLAETDIQLKNDDLTQFASGVITDPKQAVGKTLTASVPAGYPLRLDMLRAPFVIQQGQSVKIVALGRGFQVNAEGKAQTNAAAGQIVSVRLASGRVIKGTARENGTVEVPF